MSTVSSFITVLQNAHLNIQQSKCHVKNIMKLILKATKTKNFKYMQNIMICYLIHANIYKHKVFVIRYKQYISYIAAIAEF